MWDKEQVIEGPGRGEVDVIEVMKLDLGALRSYYVDIIGGKVDEFGCVFPSSGGVQFMDHFETSSRLLLATIITQFALVPLRWSSLENIMNAKIAVFTPPEHVDGPGAASSKFSCYSLWTLSVYEDLLRNMVLRGMGKSTYRSRHDQLSSGMCCV
jgi:hypothetical protein